MINFQKLNTINFPQFQNINVNMMPIIVGDVNSLPQELRGYQKIINQTRLKKGDIAYLTVRESICNGTVSQSRGGIHVEAPKMKCWGGGTWGGNGFDEGVYLASNDGACNLWNEFIEERDEFGACSPKTEPERMQANTLYWMTDRTPHEALISEKGFKRQFFRLVADNISIWYSQHNTPNPFGIKPNCEIVHHNKFH